MNRTGERAVFERIAARLAVRFHGLASAETIGRLVADSHERLRATSRVDAHDELEFGGGRGPRAAGVEPSGTADRGGHLRAARVPGADASRRWRRSGSICLRSPPSR
ncbi:three-helix bundle dimerization domain-containing protein [Actinomadura algeriensis]|uniref:Protein-tyrosine-phosphatase-like N-terminal domain-containing protein n=1 Tax=Actinomadura algeriensis TaxID=1679523 RepID=A0ABR9JYZ7_9ACTN|nr:hypothetical protein [Actinomadura algeriensis]MBE1535604.1 hypothetical protein [Actinomadura algeriensis]